MASAVQWPGHLPGPQNTLEHSGKPLGLGHYHLTAASKECVRRRKIAHASPSFLLIIPIIEEIKPHTLLPPRSPSRCPETPLPQWRVSRLPRAGVGVTARSVEADGVSLCSSLFRS